jgi:hypothetical protein
MNVRRLIVLLTVLASVTASAQRPTDPAMADAAWDREEANASHGREAVLWKRIKNTKANHEQTGMVTLPCENRNSTNPRLSHRCERLNKALILLEFSS